MLLTTRSFQLAQSPDRDSNGLRPPFFSLFPSPSEEYAQQEHARRMLLVHQTGNVKVAELIRYTLTYEPSADRIVPSPSHLHVKIKNTSAIPLRAAYLHGPFALHVATYPSSFNPNQKLQNPRREGIPQFEPNLKAGGSFTARLTVPEDIRIKSQSQANSLSNDTGKRSVTWIIEITSQILFSTSASVKFEVLVARDEKSLDYSFAAIPTSHSEPGQVHDHQRGIQGKRRRGSHSAQSKGVYSKAITLVVDDTDSLWNAPALPVWEPKSDSTRKSESRRSKSIDVTRPRNKSKKKIHLVILTHGLHSNLGADMLYVKESIDATAKAARENSRRRREAAKGSGIPKSAKNDDTPAATLKHESNAKGQDEDPSIAPISGGQEEMREDDGIDDENGDEEEIVIRGFNGNAVRTESGIQYLGKRLAKYVLNLTHPDQPFKPLKKKSISQKLSLGFGKGERDPGVPAHEGSSIRKEATEPTDLAYTFTSISFIGHSLGGLVQLYAIAYIQKHAPQFFEQIKPVNFVAMASPLLGLSNENPIYVKFALDFGLVGRTGQDLGLTWRPPTLAKSGWTAMVGGLGGGQKDQKKQDDPGAKPLLRILPTGPAHIVLRKFRNRTVYANVVNDGIVPLRTACLLFLDWSGLGKVEKARRENGLVAMIGWGWAEMTGQPSAPSQSDFFDEIQSQNDSDDAVENDLDRQKTIVPQPSENAVNDDETQSLKSAPSVNKNSSLSSKRGRRSSREDGNEGTSTFDSIWNYLRPSGKTTKNDLKMFKRSQTLRPDNDSLQVPSPDERPTSGESSSSATGSHGRPVATRGESADESNSPAPPKTTIFESAANILSPPIPPTSWIIDPSTRNRTIFHDRVYHPEDIPPPPPRRPGTKSSMGSRNGDNFSSNRSIHSSVSADDSHTDGAGPSGMRVEEKIARAYHRDLSWRKVLVRLEPDAHNNMIVRRMFANAYGWPVVKHLCDTHFGDTYAATTRDEHEPATDRAKEIDVPVGTSGEHVAGQESRKVPERPKDMMRQASSELKVLRDEGPEALQKRIDREDSVEADDSYFQDTTDDDEASSPHSRQPFHRLWTAATPKQQPTAERQDQAGTSTAEIATFLTSEPRSISSGANTPTGSGSEIPDRVVAPVRTSTLGLNKPVETMVPGPASVAEQTPAKKKDVSEDVVETGGDGQS